MLDVGGGMLDVECWMWNVGLMAIELKNPCYGVAGIFIVDAIVTRQNTRAIKGYVIIGILYRYL